MRAHPRSRGEHTRAAAGSSPVRGSSPLARGTLSARCPVQTAIGLIPARAGNTNRLHRKRNRSRAHPRSRGEHCNGVHLNLAKQGSSPLARGTRYCPGYPGWPVGLIPARAGNTRSPCCAIKPLWAHPRSRGEHTDDNGIIWIRAGSSPLARGTLRRHIIRAAAAGLIPARAGNTAVLSG